jgi:hypothetical protein
MYFYTTTKKTLDDYNKEGKREKKWELQEGRKCNKNEKVLKEQFLYRDGMNI